MEKIVFEKPDVGPDRIVQLVNDTLENLKRLPIQYPEMTSFAANIGSIMERGLMIAKLANNNEQGVKFFHPVVQVAADLLVECMKTHRDYRPDWEKTQMHPFHFSILKDLKMTLEQLEKTLRNAILSSSAKYSVKADR